MDDRVALPVHSVLDGTYRIVRVVGRGGFAITYEAEDLGLGTSVALKEYYPVDFGDRDAQMCVRPRLDRHKQAFEWARAGFLEEARTLARFEHPSIVRVVRVFEANATAYMVMRFEQGHSLESWLGSLSRPPTQDELDAIVSPLLDVLESLHGQSFLHRDIAPDNIIVRPDGTPVLLDFGAARRAAAVASRALGGMVKAGYSPHEQYASDSRLQGPWTDVYALGGTLYRAVTGRAPEEAALRVHEDRMPAAAKAATGAYRPRFLAAIDACLKVKHCNRPQCVSQLRSMLLGQSFCAKLALPCTTVRFPLHPTMGQALAGAAAALAIVAGGLGAHEYMRARPTAQIAFTAAQQRAGADEQASTRAQVEAGTKRVQDEQAAAERKAAEERARQEEEAEAAASKTKAEATVARGQFDGDWEVVGRGGDLCRMKSWKYRISIENDQIKVPDLPPGKVSPTGKFAYRYAAVGWRNVPPGHFTGTISGDTGAGRYNYMDLCHGSMKLKRL